MKKTITVLILAVFIVLGFAAAVSAQSEFEDNSVDPDIIMDEQMRKLDMSELKGFIDQVDSEVGDYIPELSVEKIVSDLRQGEIDFSFQALLQGMVKYLFHELIAHSSLMGKLVILAVISAVLYNLLDAFQGQSGKIAHTIVYLVLIVIALGSFTAAVNIGRTAIEDMVSFVQVLLPILLTLLAAIGGLSSAAIIHPFIIAALGILGTLIKNFVFPLIYFSAVLSVINHINDRFRVSQLAGVLKDLGITSLGVFLTLFVGFLGLQGAAGAVADSVTLKTAKFMTGTFVPVVGKMLADAMEVVVGTSLLLKNAIGLVGVLVLFVLCAFPVIKIMAMVIVYRIAAALVQPIGSSEVADALNTMGNALTLVFAAVAGVGLMFFMAVSVIVGLGNINVMLR